MPSHVMIHVAFLRHDYEGVSGFLLDTYGMMGAFSSDHQGFTDEAALSDVRYLEKLAAM